jgi:NADH-quinone oxidoreductase subunit C
VVEISDSSPFGVIIKKEDLLSVCQHLYKNPDSYFDMLSCITGVDNGPEAGTMEVIYHLYSIPFQQSLALKVILSRENPEVESVVSIWKSANWLEREVYDMFGILFKNHPDLRRILMPADWKGFPLRKDYKHEEYYRGVKIEY